jgi:thioredoxin-related protein
MTTRLHVWLASAVILAAQLAGMMSARGAELLMFESLTCEWCQKWDEEVGVIYAKTAEGRMAPLRRIDIYETRPADLRSVRGIIYTPTFVLWDRGREIGRVVGYPGEDGFWGLLGVIVGKLDAKPPPASSRAVN